MVIIGIALVAITALAGVFYGGSAFSNYQVQVLANTMTSVGQQVYNAGIAYMANNGQTYFSQDLMTLGNMVKIKNQNYLSDFPGVLSSDVKYGNSGNAGGYGSCQLINGNYYGTGYRFCTDANNANFVMMYSIKVNPGASSCNWPAGIAFDNNHPAIKACQKINAGKDLSAYTIDGTTGLPIYAFDAQRCNSGAGNIPENLKNTCFYSNTGGSQIGYAIMQ